MSRTTTLVAFAATVGLVVPAAWHALDADIQNDGPATRPKQQTLELDGATVAVDLDRGVLMSGGTLKATLVATSDTPKTIALEVRALEDMGYGDERVENPPKQVGKRTIEIKAAPGGGKPVEVAFKLGDRGRKGVVNWYDIEVSPAKWKASKDEADYKPTARIGAATWSGNNLAMEVQTPSRIPSDATFTVAVKVTNTQKKPINWMSIELGGANISYGGLDSQLYMYEGEAAAYTITRAEGQDESDEPLKPGESRTVKFDITPSPTELDGVKSYTFTAHAHGDRYGALDVITVKASEDKPSVAAK